MEIHLDEFTSTVDDTHATDHAGDTVTDCTARVAEHMEPPAAFRIPAREGPLQALSPDRVNGTRIVTSTSINTTTTTESSKSTEADSQDYHTSPFGSPTRKPKASSFVDPTTPNSKFSGFGGLPQSPSLPEITALRSHVRTNSDVQGLVKRFEHLDVRDSHDESMARSRKHEAELKRAHIAREEAESEAKKLKEELRRLKEENEDSVKQERQAMKQVEVARAELRTAKDNLETQRAVYEKELRKARKEAFKSSSIVLKLQDQQKSHNKHLAKVKADLQLERQRFERKEQERFEMEYRLVPLQEELHQVKQRLQTAEEEREALKTTLCEEEVARVAAEGMIALPDAQDMGLDLLSSPRKPQSPMKRLVVNDLEENKENLGSQPKKTLENKQLARELASERAKRQHAEELIEFMRAECMFRCCGCRTAARVGHDFASELDAELAAGIERIREGMQGILNLSSALEVEADVVMEIVPDHKVEQGAKGSLEVHVAAGADTTFEEEIAAEHIDRSTTFAAESPVSQKPQVDETDQGAIDEEEASVNDQAPLDQHDLEPPPVVATSEATVIPIPSEPATPQLSPQARVPSQFRSHPTIRTITTTTTVPIHFTPVAKPYPPVFDPEDSENMPPTPNSAILPDGTEVPVFDRATALAAIEYRRGRAKSLANGQATPRKQMLEGLRERRDISAPALGQQNGGTSVKLGSVSRGGSARSQR